MASALNKSTRSTAGSRSSAVLAHAAHYTPEELAAQELVADVSHMYESLTVLVLDAHLPFFLLRRRLRLFRAGRHAALVRKEGGSAHTRRRRALQTATLTTRLLTVPSLLVLLVQTCKY